MKMASSNKYLRLENWHWRMWSKKSL